MCYLYYMVCAACGVLCWLFADSVLYKVDAEHVRMYACSCVAHRNCSVSIAGKPHSACLFLVCFLLVTSVFLAAYTLKLHMA